MVTEELWLNPGDCIAELMAWIMPRASARKHRLFLVAYGRLLLPYVTDDRVRLWLELGEFMADSDEILEEISFERRSVYLHLKPEGGSLGEYAQTSFANRLISNAIASDDFLETRFGRDCRLLTGLRPNPDVTTYDPWVDPEEIHCLHEIYGNPFRNIVIEPEWRSAEVVELAREIYDTKSFSEMPRLADALLDAGCEQKEILDHCRSKKAHARGCWVLDLLLKIEQPITEPDGGAIHASSDEPVVSPGVLYLQSLLRDYPDEEPSQNLSAKPPWIWTQICNLGPPVFVIKLGLAWIAAFIYMLYEMWQALCVQ